MTYDKLTLVLVNQLGYVRHELSAMSAQFDEQE